LRFGGFRPLTAYGPRAQPFGSSACAFFRPRRLLSQRDDAAKPRFSRQQETGGLSFGEKRFEHAPFLGEAKAARLCGCAELRRMWRSLRRITSASPSRI